MRHSLNTQAYTFVNYNFAPSTLYAASVASDAAVATTLAHSSIHRSIVTDCCCGNCAVGIGEKSVTDTAKGSIKCRKLDRYIKSE